MKPLLLVLIHLSDIHQAQLRERFELLYAPDADSAARAIAERGGDVRIVLTNGSTGIAAAALDALPRVGLVSAMGVGFENIAVDHARARGIALSNGAGTNSDCVADHAFALLLAVVRNVPAMDGLCRAGVWRDKLTMPPQLARKRMGLLGLGDIGRKIAQRGLGFDMQIGYHTRNRRDDVAFTHFDSLEALAQWCDVLVIATPGGPQTRHLVGASVLQALGPKGMLVNIARGSVVDTAALAEALRSRAIAGAGLDVYESEPQPPEQLFDLPGVVLSPHIAGWSPEAIQASVDQFVENARLHLNGLPLATPI